MTGREAAKLHKAERLLREANAALVEYLAIPKFGYAPKLEIARVADQAIRGADELERQFKEAGR